MRVFLFKGGSGGKISISRYSHMMLMNKYLQETFDYGELFINGDGGCHTYQDYTQWLKKKNKII